MPKRSLSMSKLEPIALKEELRAKEQEIFCLGSVLAQIEIASCFRKDEEPLLMF